MAFVGALVFHKHSLLDNVLNPLKENIAEKLSLIETDVFMLSSWTRLKVCHRINS